MHTARPHVDESDARQTTNRAPQSTGLANVVAIATSLHQLALRYWADGRPSDAHRIEQQAQAILADHGVDGELLLEVASTLHTLAAELRSR
jgi:hypothetical protein